MKINFSKKVVVFIAICALTAVLWPRASRAASLLLDPTTKDVSVGVNFTVTVSASSPTASINGVSGRLNYPTDILQLVSVSSHSSILDQWLPPGAKGPVTSTKGAIIFEGISLAGYRGNSGKVFSVVFKPLKEGDAKISFSNGSILANDGEGTNVMTASAVGNYHISAAQATPETPEIIEPATETPVVTPVSTPAPVITPAASTIPISTILLALLILIAILLIIIIILTISLVRTSRQLAQLEGEILEMEHEHERPRKKMMG